MTDLQTLFQNALSAMNNAYCPYSNFAVGVALCTANDKIFAGCNVENASFAVTICAEGNAVSNMVGAGERLIKDIVIVAKNMEKCAPCGACRQIIIEFADSNTQVHLFNVQGEAQGSYRAFDLVPERFVLEKTNATIS